MAKILNLTIRDYCFEARRKDQTCGILEELVRNSETGLEVDCGEIIDADRDTVRKRILEAIATGQYHAIITTGAIGIAPDDFMPELLVDLSDKHLFALGRIMWEAVGKLSPVAALTRPRAGIHGTTLLLALPGSPKMARLTLESVLGLMPVAMRWASETDHNCGEQTDWFDWS
jgi:molybdenum cofactor synthesis domain-containing protein